jgi:hypothetical protein
LHHQGSSSPRPQNLLHYWPLKMKAVCFFDVLGPTHSDVISHPRGCESSVFILFERLLRTFCFLYCTVQNNWHHNVMVSCICLSVGNHIYQYNRTNKIHYFLSVYYD